MARFMISVLPPSIYRTRFSPQRIYRRLLFGCRVQSPAVSYMYSDCARAAPLNDGKRSQPGTQRSPRVVKTTHLIMGADEEHISQRSHTEGKALHITLGSVPWHSAILADESRKIIIRRSRRSQLDLPRICVHKPASRAHTSAATSLRMRRRGPVEIFTRTLA